MYSDVEYICGKNEKFETRGRFKNVYFIDGKFEYFTDNTYQKIKSIMISKNEFLDITVKYFKSNNEINDYLVDKNISVVEDITCHCIHFYDWNVAHGLYDTLYPLFLSLLYFNKESFSFNIFLNLLDIDGWRFPGIASREWVLDIFKTFCGGNVIRSNSKNNFKFKDLIIGHALSGISNVNKHCEMPGKDIFALEKFRDRMYEKYDIDDINNDNNNTNIIIINSRRYSESERNELLRIKEYFINKSYKCLLVDWSKIDNFKEQLEIMKNTQIHISGAGTSMLNFPFLPDNALHVNMGVRCIDECNIPGLLEVNICMLSNNINCMYYDIFKEKTIKYEPTINIIENYLVDNKKPNPPEYVKHWREYCIQDKDNMEQIILKMNGIIKPHLMGYRHPELLIHKQYPFNKENNMINHIILNNIKIKKNTIFQIYHDKTLVPAHISDNIKKLNPEYNYLLLDFDDGKEIIRREFHDVLLKDKIINAIDNMPRYCHKSDLLRYCLLYIYGGVYIDVDLQPLLSFKNMIPTCNITFLTSIGGGPNPYIVNSKKIHCGMANGILMTTKQNKILLDLINFSVNNKNLYDKNPTFRGDNVYYLFNYLRDECKRKNIIFEPFKLLNIYDENVYLFNTYVDNIEHYGSNCIINEKQVVINPNNPKYQCKRQSSSFI